MTCEDAKQMGGGSFTPTKMGGGAKVLAMLKEGGRGTKSFEVVLTRRFEILAILKGGAKRVHPLKKKGGGKKFYPVLREGAGR